MLNVGKETPLVLNAMNILRDVVLGQIGPTGKELQFEHTACPGMEKYLNGYKHVNTFHWCLTFRVNLLTKQRKVNRCYTEYKRQQHQPYKR